MFRLKVAYLSLATVAILVAPWSTATSALQPENEKKEMKKLKELRDERLLMVTKIHEMTVKSYVMQRIGHPTIDQVHQVKVSLLSAKLELCKSKEDRMKVYEEMFEDAKEWEKRVERNMVVPDLLIDYLKAKTHRLELEIELTKLKAPK